MTLPAKGYIVREIIIHYDVHGNPASRLQQPAGRHSLYHITESPDELPTDHLPLEQITLSILKNSETPIPPTLLEEEADWFFDFDEEIALDNGTRYVQLSDHKDRSLTHSIKTRKAVYKRKEERK